MEVFTLRTIGNILTAVTDGTSMGQGSQELKTEKPLEENRQKWADISYFEETLWAPVA